MGQRRLGIEEDRAGPAGLVEMSTCKRHRGSVPHPRLLTQAWTYASRYLLGESGERFRMIDGFLGVMVRH